LGCTGRSEVEVEVEEDDKEMKMENGD